MSDPTNLRPLSAIFDRPRSQHPWLRGLEEMANHSTFGYSAIAANWCMDHRVSPRREQQLLEASHFSGETDPEAWWAERLAYFQHALCLPSEAGVAGRRSAYLDDPNASNAIPPGTLPHHERLIHVASLNAILWRLSSNAIVSDDLEDLLFDLTGLSFPSKPIGGMAPDLAAFNGEVETIAMALDALGVAKVRGFAGALCDTLGDTQPPWWACFAQEARPFVDNEDWIGLCRALGLGHLNAGDWLMVWEYEVGVAGSLFRPTVVEANTSPYHYPSPPTQRYGIAMPLASANMGALREVVHGSLRGQAAIDGCTGRLGLVAKSPIKDHTQLYNLRVRHRRRLAREVNHQRDENWLKRHAYRK